MENRSQFDCCGKSHCSAGFDTRPGVTSISITCPVLSAALCSKHQIPGTAGLLQRWSCISCPPVCTTQRYHLSANGIPEHLSTSSQDSKALRRSPKCSVRQWVLCAAAATFVRFPDETAILRCCGGARLWAPHGYLVAGSRWADFSMGEQTPASDVLGKGKFKFSQLGKAHQ